MAGKIILTAALALLTWAAVSADECNDTGVCKLPGASSDAAKSGVLSPVGPSSIARIEQAPRLDTLDGKTIAIVGGSFMASVTHPELRRLIRQHYRGTKIYVLSEIGSAGPWPGPGVVRQQKDEFMRKLRELKVDAVISGNGGCGLCTPKEMGSCIAAEYAGLPSVMIAAPGFAEQAKRAALTAGVPIPRVAVYPGAFSAHTRDELVKNTREVLFPQIVEALTAPLSADELAEAGKELPPGGIVFSGNFDEVNLHFAQNGWSDGLPIVPPTEERVSEFLKYTDLEPDAVIAAIPPSYRQATARLVAVNGVMSGCPPEYMPILIAFTRALTDGDFRRTLASTHAWTPFCWINGPVARQLELDGAQGEISNQRNARIGRFINLAMLNLGGYHIKENRMGTFGYLMPWCLVEDDAAAVALGWRPYHMQQGYELNDSVLTAASSLAWGNNLAPATADPQKIMEMMAWDAVEKEQFALGSGTPFVYRTMLMTGYVARDLARKYKSKEELEAALVAAARRPLADRAYANYWGNPGSSFDPERYSVERHAENLGRKEHAEETATPPWLAWTGRSRMETVPVMLPGKTALLVTGDENRNKTMCVPGGGFATVRIELPRNWDKLMAAAGYRPLAEFYLKSDLKPLDKPQQYRDYRGGHDGGERQGGSRQEYRRRQNAGNGERQGRRDDGERRTNGERPQFSEETRRLAGVCRRDPSEANRAALKKQIGVDYDRFLEEQRAKLKKGKRDRDGQDAARRLEAMSRDRDKYIDRIMRRMLDPQARPGNGGRRGRD
jgi:hypothetical protein